jgi:uncharacterized protein (DUF4415 family)
LTERKRTKAEERANTRLHDVLLELEEVSQKMSLRFAQLKLEHIPPEWSLVERLSPVRRRKVRVNTAIDEDVANFFRGMGHGYQARMNLVLRTYVAAVLSRYISKREDENWMGDQI